MEKKINGLLDGRRDEARKREKKCIFDRHLTSLGKAPCNDRFGHAAEIPVSRLISEPRRGSTTY
jgi:hypothetical protein